MVLLRQPSIQVPHLCLITQFAPARPDNSTCLCPHRKTPTGSFRNLHGLGAQTTGAGEGARTMGL